MGVTDEPIWDGNGGTLDPRKSTQRDLLIALHVKVDRVIKDAADIDYRMRKQENGELTPAQRAVVQDIAEDAGDHIVARRNARVPILALVTSLAALISSIVLTLTVGGIH